MSERPGMDINLSAGNPNPQGPDVMEDAQCLDQLEGLDDADMEWVVHALLAYTEEEEEGLNESTTSNADVCESHDTRGAAEGHTSPTLSSDQTDDGSVRASGRVRQRTSARVNRKQAREQRRRRELNDSFSELVQVLSEVEAGEGLQPGSDKSWSDHPKGKRSAFRVAVLCRTVYALRYMRQAKKVLRQKIRRLSLKLESLEVAADKVAPEATKAHVCGGSLCSSCSRTPWPSVDVDKVYPYIDDLTLSVLAGGCVEPQVVGPESMWSASACEEAHYPL